MKRLFNVRFGQNWHHHFLHHGNAKSYNAAVSQWETKAGTTLESLGAMCHSEKKCHRKQRCGEKRLPDSTFSRGGPTSSCLSFCYSATCWWRSSCPSLHPVSSSLNTQTELIIGSRAYPHLHPMRPRRQPKRPRHTHTDSWTRRPLHWPWPMNSRVLFHLLQQHSC